MCTEKAWSCHVIGNHDVSWYARQIISSSENRFSRKNCLHYFVVLHKSESQKVYLWSKLKKSSLFDAHLEIPSKCFINIAQGPGKARGPSEQLNDVSFGQ